MKKGEVISDGPWTGFEIIHTYSRAEAIEDGVLIDVSNTAKEAGIKFPVTFTRELWDRYIEPSEKDKSLGQDSRGRLWDALWLFRNAAKSFKGDILIFQVYFMMNGELRMTDLKAVCGPGDDAEPVVTIMLPEED